MLVLPVQTILLYLLEIGLLSCSFDPFFSIYSSYFFVSPNRSYADSTCSQKDIFYGWKNGVCLNSLGSSSMKYSYPTLYSYSSSSTCSGTFSTSDLSSLATTCNKNYAGSSSHYYYLHSDGSTVST